MSKTLYYNRREEPACRLLFSWDGCRVPGEAMAKILRLYLIGVQSIITVTYREKSNEEGL